MGSVQAFRAEFVVAKTGEKKFTKFYFHALHLPRSSETRMSA